MFVSHELIEAFLILQVSGQIQIHLGFSLIPGCSMFLYSSHLLVLDSTLCTLPFCIWVLLALALLLILLSLFIHRVLLAFLPSFLFIGIDCFWTWRRWSLNIKWLSWVPLPSKTLPHRILPNRSLKRAKSALLKSCVFNSVFPSSLPSRFWTPPSHGLCRQDYPWPSHPNKPLHVGMKSSNVHVFSSISQRRKLSTTHSRHLACLCLAVLSLQPMLGWLKPLMRTTTWELGAASICLYRVSSTCFSYSGGQWQRPPIISPLPVLCLILTLMCSSPLSSIPRLSYTHSDCPLT